MTIYRLFLKYAYPTLLGILFTTLLTWPLITKLSTFYTDKGDYPLVGWILWHNQKAITEGFIFDQIKYFDAGQFYPYPFSLAFSEHLFIPSIIFTIIYSFTNSVVFSTNTLFILSLLLSFLTSFLVIYYFLKDKICSTIGALTFTFNPLTFAHFNGHFHLLSKYFLPPLFLFGYFFLIKPNLKNSVFFLGFFTLNALSSVYFGIFSAVVMLILLSVYLIGHLISRNYKYILNLFKFGLLLIIFLPLMLYFYLPYLEFSDKEHVVRPFSEIVYYSARLIDWISPHPNSLVYGEFYQNMAGFRNPRDENNNFNYSEHTLFTNIIPTILFILGIIFSIKYLGSRHQLVNKSAVFYFSAIAFISFVFCFGPLFTGWNNQNGSFKLPYFFLYKILPILSAIRVPSRFEFIFYVPFSLFVSLGFYYIYKTTKAKFKLFVLLLILLLLFLENFNFLPVEEKSAIFEKFGSDTYRKQLGFLKDQNTIHFPINFDNYQKEAGYLNWATITDERIFNGYSGYTPSDRNKYLEKIKKIEEGALERLFAIGIGYVILHKDLFADFKKFYNQNGDFYNIGKIFEDDNILIIGLKKYNFNVGSCTGSDELSVQLISTPYLIKGSENFYYFFNKVRIVNPNNCYFVSTFQERYLPFKTQFKGDTIYIKLPILIEPKEEIEIKI